MCEVPHKKAKQTNTRYIIHVAVVAALCCLTKEAVTAWQFGIKCMSEGLLIVQGKGECRYAIHDFYT